MKSKIIGIPLLTLLASTPALALHKVYDEASLQAAIAEANSNPGVDKIVFAKRAYIKLSAPVVYNGEQALTLLGNGAIIDGSDAGSFVLDEDQTATTEDGTLIFNTAGDVTLRRLTIKNSATRGVVVNIPDDATGSDIAVTLKHIDIVNSALYGLHIDDNADDFDDGNQGSAIGIDLTISHSMFINNGTGAIDFDGIRVDEREDGDINAWIVNTQIDANGGDGIELDEAGDGDVDATMINTSISDNGFFNEADLDDGFDIDEAGDGDIEVTLMKIDVSNNKDEGLDFDEEGEGDVELKLRHITARNNNDEAIKVDEEDDGDIKAKMSHIYVKDSGDDGIQFTELGEGKIATSLKRVYAKDNAKYGIKIEQWVEEDEPAPIETAGWVKTQKVILSGNGSGDEIKTNNVIVE